jgi:hypothetical protein
MSQPYSSKEVQLESDDRTQIKGLVDEVNSRLQELATLVSRVTDMPLAQDGVPRRFEIREDAVASDSGVMIIHLPTDPPSLGCGYYTDGEYTKVVVPCTEIVLPSGTVIDLSTLSA